MITGLVMLCLLAAAVVPAWIRLRRRVGLGVARRHWATALALFAAAVVALWITVNW